MSNDDSGEDNTNDGEPELPEINIDIGYWGGIVLVVIGILIFAFLGVGSFVAFVDEGDRAVVTQFGDLDRTWGPGLHFKIPIVEKVHRYEVREQVYTMSSKSGEGNVAMRDDSIKSLSKGGLQITADITVRYQIDRDEVEHIYSNVASSEAKLNERIIRPTIRNAILEATSNYGAEAIYSERRGEVQNSISQLIEEEWEGGDVGVDVVSVQLRHVGLPKSIEREIQEKEQMQHRIERKQRQVEVEEREKQRKIVEAEGIAESNEIISGSLTSNYLRWYWIGSLDNHNSVQYVPTGGNGGGQMPVFTKDVDNIQDESVDFGDAANASVRGGTPDSPILDPSDTSAIDPTGDITTPAGNTTAANASATG